VATVAAYVDGFNLYYGMKAAYRRKYLWLDVVELVRRLRPKDQIAIVRYFSAVVKNEPAAAKNQTDYLEALQAQNGASIDVRLGRFKDRTIRPCRRCGKPYSCGCPREYKSYEEKETDVALGAMMVADAALGVGDVTLLISADSDLVPAVEAVKLVDPTRPVYLGMPPGNLRPSKRFTNVGSFYIRESALLAAQLPPAVVDRNGSTYVRPGKWA